MPIEVNAYKEISATAEGQSTDEIATDVAPSISNGRYSALIWVESTGGATGVVTLQVKPNQTENIVGWVDALQIDITASELTCIKSYDIQKGMTLRAYVTTHSGTGNLNIRVDLGIN